MGFFSRFFKIREQDPGSDDTTWAIEDNASELVLDAEYASTLMAEIDIDAAIGAHENLKDQLQQWLAGAPGAALQSHLLCVHDGCLLGQWLDGRGQEMLGQYPAFGMLVARHKYFHVQAAAVLAHGQAGEPDKALKTLQGSYRHASNQVVLLLKELKRGLGR